MKCVFVTGGTGGHIYPALTLAKIVQKETNDNEVVFIGNNDRMEAKIIPEYGYRFYGLTSKGLAGSLKQKGKALALVPKAFLEARKILKAEHAQICVGFGGYVTTPVILAAKSLGIKTILHEQNSVFGKANQVIANQVDAIVTCYEQVAGLRAKNVHLLGNPRASEVTLVQPDFQVLDELQLDSEKKKILIVMGSLGSSSVNERMANALGPLSEQYEIILVSGHAHFEETKALFTKTKVHVLPYINQLAVIDGIDLLICRAGATTAAEICAKGTLAILIPSPYVANNHQYFNALALKQQGACELLEEKEIDQVQLETLVHAILDDEAKQRSMKEQALALGKPNAAYDMLALLHHVLEVK